MVCMGDCSRRAPHNYADYITLKNSHVVADFMKHC